MKFLASIVLMALSLTVHADTPMQILERLQAEAGTVASVERGRQFYHGKFTGGRSDSCASCHTQDPRAAGRHERTNKAIEPLSPTVNRERFSDPEKVEKWFKRNCNDVLGRACSAREKADFTAYVIAPR